MSFQLWLALLSASILISLSPGAGAATAMSYGLTTGVRGAAAAVAGLICGYGTQMLVVSLGLGGLVATSPLLFNLIKWIGAAYLIFLGIKLWRAQSVVHTDTTVPIRKTWQSRWISAYLVNITNPKGMVFLLALIPQFVDLNSPDHGNQLVIICLTLLAVDWVVMTGYSLLAASMSRLLQSERGARWQGRISGTALIIAGGALSLATL